MKKHVTVLALALMMVMGTAQAAFATSQYYHFNDNIPNIGWVSSTYKTLPAGIDFRTTLSTCTAVDGSSQGALGVLMKPVRSDQYQYAYKTVKPGYTNYLLLSHTTSSRSVRIDQQAVGTSYVDDTGYWYY